MKAEAGTMESGLFSFMLLRKIPVHKIHSVPPIDFIQISIHNNIIMKKNCRTDERFSEIGRFESGSLCVLPGVLENVSAGGCKVYFPVSLEPDMEKDYTAQVHFPEPGIKPALTLVCHPCWTFSREGKTFMGFILLRSPDTPGLMSHIAFLRSNSAEESSDIKKMIFNSAVSFVS